MSTVTKAFEKDVDSLQAGLVQLSKNKAELKLDLKKANKDLADIEKAFIFADFGNAIVMSINIIAIILLSKELRKLTKEWCDRQTAKK